MEKAVSGNVTTFVDRRLHPVRLSISHLNQIMEGARRGSMVNVNADLLMSITSTLELFMEDFETNCLGSTPPAEERKKVQASTGAEKVTESPRITQTRVS